MEFLEHSKNLRTTEELADISAKEMTCMTLCKIEIEMKVPLCIVTGVVKLSRSSSREASCP